MTGQPLRVLVVEDEPLVAQAHASYVPRVPGFELAAVTGTVREAVAVIVREQVDLVLLDLHLPDGHGLDIVRAIRTAARPVDILTITAARDVHLVRAAVSLGVIGYLLKPFVFADLRQRLVAYRDYRNSLGDAESATQSLVDAMLRDLHPVPTNTGTPKGLSRDVLDRVIRALRETTSEDGHSASEVGQAVGVSRVTARRYLEHLVESGAAVRGQRLGGTGRPEVTFQWR